MSARAVVLFSGGLDSMLAIRILQRQGLDIEAVTFRTQFSCCGDASCVAAARLGVRLTVFSQDESYLDILRRPQFGYGRGANPCVDCRIYMFKRAKWFMEEISASFVASGEVLGQRPNSQTRRDLERIEIHSELEGRLLRPLSARLLAPTAPEREGIIQRDELYDFSGRSRKGLIRLAHECGFRDEQIPSPSTGCMLTEKTFAPRVFDLLEHTSENRDWDFQLLKVGRHIRHDASTKMVIGRRAQENAVIEYLARHEAARPCALLLPENFAGPAVLLVGNVNDHTLQSAGQLVARYTNHAQQGPLIVSAEQAGRRWLCEVRAIEPALPAMTL
jgi:hypothetical protein